MNLLDSNCWILEPLKPTKTDFYRRISLNPNVSIKVLVDPRNPREIPQITFLGSEDSNNRSGSSAFKRSPKNRNA